MQMLEIIPLIAFFVAYKFKGIIFATGVLVVLSVLSLAISYFKNGKVSKVALVSTIIIVVFGVITVFSGDSSFIKMKPTILNAAFGVILMVGVMRKKGWIKHVLGQAFKAPEEVWVKLSTQWAVFFLVMAVVNEFVWRNFSEDFWVNFKTFGFFPMSIILMIVQFPILKKYASSKDKK